MAHSDSGLRRVSVYADTAVVDLALPADVPVVVLMPSIAEFVAPQTQHPMTATPYRLTHPVTGVFDSSKTLAQNGIHDGAVLAWTGAEAEPPPPRIDDTAEQVVTAVDAAMGRTPPTTARILRAVAGSWLAVTGAAALILMRGTADATGTRHLAAGAAAGVGCAALIAAVLARRVADDRVGGTMLALWATGFAAVAGFAAVPGGPTASNVLLGAMATSTMSVVALHLTGCGATALAAVSGVAGVAAVAALAATVAAVPVPVVGSVTAAASVGALPAAVRVSVTSAGLTPKLGSGPAADAVINNRAARAHQTLTCLIVVLSTAAALGAIGAVSRVHGADSPQRGGIVFAAAAGVVLLLRARSHTDRVQVVALLAGGTAAVAASALAATVAMPSPPAQAGTAVAVVSAAALCGVDVSVSAVSPWSYRVLEMLEHLTLAAIAPLTCWVCGLLSTEPLTNLL